MSAEKTHILMIDDDEEDFLITRDIVSSIGNRKYAIDWASSFEEGVDAFSKKKYDVYLVDYRLGIHTGLELIHEAQKMGVDVPLILMTGQNDPLIDEKAMKAGASDYLVKGTISPDQLDRTIRYSIEQVKNLKEIVKLNEVLEDRVKERTLVLEKAMTDLERSKQELSSALDKEKELNELKLRFVSMASHEFRTPLTTILSSLTLIERYTETSDLEKLPKHFTRIKSSITGMTDLLNDVLSLSKLEEGMVIIMNDHFNLKEFVQGLADELQGILKNGQEIEYVHEGKSETVNTDKKVMRNIFLNLISNAIKFSGEEKKINIRTRLTASELSVDVSDHGIGIGEEDLKHLFQRFFRGKNVTNIQGTGLGLSIVSRYVELLNGRIDVESKLGVGTTFRIRIPMKKD